MLNNSTGFPQQEQDGDRRSGLLGYRLLVPKRMALSFRVDQKCSS